jgi:hypothetical protein
MKGEPGLVTHLAKHVPDEHHAQIFSGIRPQERPPAHVTGGLLCVSLRVLSDGSPVDLRHSVPRTCQSLVQLPVSSYKLQT